MCRCISSSVMIFGFICCQLSLAEVVQPNRYGIDEKCLGFFWRGHEQDLHGHNLFSDSPISQENYEGEDDGEDGWKRKEFESARDGFKILKDELNSGKSLLDSFTPAMEKLIGRKLERPINSSEIEETENSVPELLSDLCQKENSDGACCNGNGVSIDTDA